ncbi:hypothetical protein D9M68_728690 [compost metagenome]
MHFPNDGYVAVPGLIDRHRSTDGEVAVAGVVHTEVEAQARIQLADDWGQVALDPVFDIGIASVHRLVGEVVVQGQAQHLPAVTHGVLDPHTGDAHAATITRDGIQLFTHLSLAWPVGVANLLVPGFLALGGGLFALHEAHALIQPVGHRVVEGGRVDHGVVAIAAFADVGGHPVEGVGLAVVRADDDDPAAPDQQRGRGIEHGRHVAVEGGLVEDDLALQPAQVGRVAGQRDDLEAAGVADAVGIDLTGVAAVVLILEEELFDLAYT